MILSIIGKIIDMISGLVFKLLKFFNLQLLFITALLGLILYLFGALEIGWVKTAMYVLTGVSAFYAITLTILAPFKKNRREKGARGNKRALFSRGGNENRVEEKTDAGQTVKTAVEETKRQFTAVENVNENESENKADSDKPIYYTVRQNPEYVMAEYRDRVELYKKTPEGLIYIRTDEKRKDG